MTLGNYVKLGDGVTLGEDVTLGNYVKLGAYVTLGDGVTLCDCVRLGEDVTLGEGVKLGAGVTLGDDSKTFTWSPLQIQGSRHLLYVAGPTIIGVGCIRESASWGRENYRAIGLKEFYTADQVEEYKAWLDIAIAWQAKLPKVSA